MGEPPQSMRAVTLWREAIEANEAFLLAGMRRRLGPDADLLAERRRLYERWADEHDETVRRMVARVNEALTSHG